MLQRLLNLASLVVLLHSVCTTAAKDNNNYFIQPPDAAAGDVNDYSKNNVYVEGSEIQVRWATNYTKLSLALCNNPKKPSALYISDMRNVGQTTFYKWKVDTMTFDLDVSNIFWLDIYAEDDTERQTPSGYFNISRAANQPSSSSSASASASTSASSTSSVQSVTGTPTAAPINTAVPTQTASSGGMSTTTKIGLGVGLGIGIVGIAVGIFGAVLLRRAMKNKKADAPDEMAKVQPPAHQPFNGYNAYHGAYSPVPKSDPMNSVTPNEPVGPPAYVHSSLQEAPGNTGIQEAPGHEVQPHVEPVELPTGSPVRRQP